MLKCTLFFVSGEGHAKDYTIYRAVVCATSLWLAQAVAVAKTIELTCGPNETIGNAVQKLAAGDTLLVSGTCNESVDITSDVSRITLDGQGKATIIGPGKNAPVIAVRGREITIKGFTVTGGRQGIYVSWGGMAVVDGNTLEKTGRTGITVAQNSSARIINNTVRENPNQGILVAGNSFAWIGFHDNVDDSTAKPNTVQGNAVGIEVDRGSAARIHGNIIASNKSSGVAVERGSQADVGGNIINANGGDGIFVVSNSTVNLGSDSGNDFRRTPNTSDATNGGFGIRCSISSSADGRLGSLKGSKGGKDFTEPGCVDSLLP